MIQTLAVPPPQIRPSIEMNPEKKAEDDITTAYVKIINLNNELKKTAAHEKQNKIDDLERTIASIMIKLNRAKLDKLPTNKKKVIKAYKSISDRLKGK
jgi:DNA-directed RNA polymerase beta' subunit